MVVGIRDHLKGERAAQPSPEPTPEQQPQQPQHLQQPSRRLAAIMFTDLVGYSAMAHRDEALAIDLLEQHRRWVRKIIPHHGGREIETVGDAFLIEFGSALAAVECAVALQHRFALHNQVAPEQRRMQLRVGIHLGDVEHAGDKVMGDGVNIASRIHGMAEPGGICVSEDVQRAVRNRGGLAFTSMGSPKLKNIETPLELFKVHAGAAAAAAATPGTRAGAARHATRIAGATSAALLGGARHWIGKVPRWLWILLTVVVLIKVLGGDDEEFVKVERRDEPPSIAVLPFENLSDEPDSAFFTDGLHDTVIGHLSRVSGLKVISRTSVMGYRGKEKSLRRIGRELHADHILEGSVQRSGNRLRVVAQLIEADTDTHVWSQEYDHDLKDVFAVQADIAKSVAAAVKATLTSQEAASIEAIPTKNPAAYDLYLRALIIERRTDAKADDYRQGLGWLEQAVALDPAFAAAYAQMAYLHDALFWAGFDPSDARRARIEENADIALRLDPKLPEAHIGKALFHYHGWRDYDAALKELEVARGLAPNNARVHFWLAPIYRRQGRWEQSLESFDRATALDPLNSQYLLERAGTLQMLRRYKEAGEAYARVASFEKDNPLAPVPGAFNAFFATGELKPLADALATIPAGVDPYCQVTGLKTTIAALERRFADLAAMAFDCKEKFVPNSGGAQIPIEYYVAQVKWIAAGRKTPPEAARARAIIEDILARRPDLPEVRMNLAALLAMQGEKQRAIEEADRALEDMPLSRDALTGAALLRGAVDVFANAGAEERAITELERALSLPNGGHVREVRLDPVLDPLRGNPRFEKLLAEHLAKGG
jgi:adenylate cyclase